MRIKQKLLTVLLTGLCATANAHGPEKRCRQAGRHGSGTGLYALKTNTMRVVPGTYELMVGSSSADNNLKKFNVTIQ